MRQRACRFNEQRIVLGRIEKSERGQECFEQKNIMNYKYYKSDIIISSMVEVVRGRNGLK